MMKHQLALETKLSPSLRLEGHEDQPYRYAGADVYAARCALLHAFGSEAQAHRSDTSVKLFGYHNGGRHSFDPEISPNLVILGTASFLNDVRHAVDSFNRDCETDPGPRAKVEARLPEPGHSYSPYISIPITPGRVQIRMCRTIYAREESIESRSPSLLFGSKSR